MSLTLDPAKLWSRSLVDAELARLREEFAKFADVTVTTDAAILSLIGNVARSNEILERTFRALGKAGICVKMISQGASKVNISMLVDDAQADEAVRALHAEFFEVPVSGRAAAGAQAVLHAAGR